ncbi:uncharacterized protein TM35_000133110 [Trypanosoma theileri]|uniref:RRM domain-containing protein n=1 Tax=Trypanosoma theileri TaxID=67003 RepID=A0A1X0NX72_9TRYP|nr:uncharacterized protein TM35_000133110 [Trypanosoma theileri]ORC89307.1 hypothetical protein TM35_000133110 [Trypanosoma theileri]
MFALRNVLSDLPSDGATKRIKVGNVVSPMSSADVANLFPDALSWRFVSPIKRTDYVVLFENESLARIAMRTVEGLSYLGEKLRFTYLQDDEECESSLSSRMTCSYPHLCFLLPEVSYQSRCVEAERIISSVGTTYSSHSRWVDVR